MLFGNAFIQSTSKFFQGRDEPKSQKRGTGRFISKPKELSLIAMQPAWYSTDERETPFKPGGNMFTG